MGYEIVIATAVGGVFSVITILLLNHNWFKRKEMEYRYNINRFKLGKRYKMKEQELPKKSEKSIVEQLKGIDPATVKSVMGMLQSGEEEGTEEEEDQIGQLLANPAVKNLLKQITSGSGGQDQQTQDISEMR